MLKNARYTFSLYLQMLFGMIVGIPPEGLLIPGIDRRWIFVNVTGNASVTLMIDYSITNSKQ